LYAGTELSTHALHVRTCERHRRWGECGEKEILGKSTGKVGNLEVKNTIVTPSAQEKNKDINNIFLFIVRLLLIMIVKVLVDNFEFFLFIVL